MNPKLEQTHFGATPKVSMQRSVFTFPLGARTTFDAGLLIPFKIYHYITPGDTFDVTGSFVIRATNTFVHPVMDNLYADIFGVFCPYRILWDHWKEFLGQNSTGAWAPTTQYTIPQIKFEYKNAVSHSIQVGDIANYMGLPLFTGTNNDGKLISVSALPFRAYILTWNELFRNQMLQAPAKFFTGDSTMYVVRDNRRGNDTYDGWLHENINTDSEICPKPAPVNKLPDYFTTAHIAPNTGEVTLPLGSYAPVNILEDDTFGEVDNATILLKHSTDGAAAQYTNNLLGITQLSQLDAFGGSQGSNSLGADFTIANVMRANLANAVAASVDAQRLAFATQKILYRMGFGMRWREIIQNFFGVSVGDQRAQIPELLFAKRVPIQFSEVTQTSETTATSSQGNQAAYSLTTETDHLFRKSFVEHGLLMFFVTIRQAQHSYSQGIERGWSYKERFDFYWPQLANLGEQQIKMKEIFADGTSNDEEIFGYQERWAEYRWGTQTNTGLFNPKATGTLASWGFGDSYDSAPVLQSDWSIETKAYIERALTVQNEPQFLIDALMHVTAARCMPLYSVPSLIDHF